MKKIVLVLFAVIGMCAVISCENIATDTTQEAESIISRAYNFIYGTSGNDRINGTSSADNIKARAGNDTIYGGSGNDVLYGEDGNDFLSGGEGDDTLYGGDGDDRIYGDTGNDIIEVTDRQNDAIYPGAGNDVVIINKTNTQDSVTFGSGNDTIELTATYFLPSPASPRLTIMKTGTGTKKLRIINTHWADYKLSHAHYDADNKTNFYVKDLNGRVVYTIDVKGYTSLESTHWLDISIVR